MDSHGQILRTRGFEGLFRSILWLLGPNILKKVLLGFWGFEARVVDLVFGGLSLVCLAFSEAVVADDSALLRFPLQIMCLEFSWEVLSCFIRILKRIYIR